MVLDIEQKLSEKMSELEDGFYMAQLKDNSRRLCYVGTRGDKISASFLDGKVLPVSPAPINIEEYVLSANLDLMEPEKLCADALKLVYFVVRHLNKSKQEKAKESKLATG